MATKRRDSLDDSSRAMIYDGLNLSELGRLFHMDHRVLVEKLHGVAPSGKRGSADTYQVHEVAPYLVKPIFDIEAYVKRMNHADLPKMLTKEFWAGQRSKQEYLLKAGDLWPTAEVIKSVGELMKLMKMSVQLMSDGVERQVELSDRQRALIKGMCDGLLSDLRHAVIENFSVGAVPETADVGEDEDSL
jgi:hypothetical protein